MSIRLECVESAQEVSLEVEHVPQPVLGVVVARGPARHQGLVRATPGPGAVLATTEDAVRGAEGGHSVAVDHENNRARVRVVVQP